MQDLNTFYNWMIEIAGITKSTAQHYKSGLSACSKDFMNWFLTEKPLVEMSLSELDVVIVKAFLNSNFVDKNTRGKRMYSNSLKQYRNFLASNNGVLLDTKYEQFIDSNVSETDRIALINARVGQGIFREKQNFSNNFHKFAKNFAFLLTFMRGYAKIRLLNRGADEQEYPLRSAYGTARRKRVGERVSPPKRNPPPCAGHTG